MKIRTAFFALLLAGCHHEIPVAAKPAADDPAIIFARDSVTMLAAGAPGAQDVIEWTTLQGSSLDVGALYRALPDDRERADFRAAFVTHFSSTLHEQGVDISALTSWRVDDRRGDTVVVTATAAAGELRVTVRDGHIVRIGQNP